MALTVQTDNGMALGANSYQAVADFKAYHSDRGNDYSLFSNPASDVLTTVGVFSNAETITIGGKVYTLQTVLTNVDGNIKIGASTALTLVNIANAINLGAGLPGTDYAVAMTANPFVTAVAGTFNLTVTAIVWGTAGNTITATETGVNASWASTTLAGGAGSDVLLSAALVRASQYLDTRFSFVGRMLVTNNVPAADAFNTTGVISDGETLTIGNKIYTFQTVLTNVNGHIHIGTSVDLTISNLINAINLSGNGTPGTDYASNSVIDANVSATKPVSGTMMVTAITAGLAGNSITMATTCLNASLTSPNLVGGLSPQTTQWPRQAGDMTIWPVFDTNFMTPMFDVMDDTGANGFVALVGPDSQQILGIPQAVKFATNEYALRALAAPLYQDAPAPAGGRLLTSLEQSVDTLKQSQQWQPSQAGGFAMPAYPIADMMLARAGLIQLGRVLIR